MKHVITVLSHSLFKRILFFLVILLTSIGLFHYVMKNGLNWYYTYSPETLLKDIPFYAVIQEHDPELYQRINQDIKVAFSQDETAHELRTRVRGYLDGIIASRVPMASNEAVVAYMKVTLKEMQALEKQGYDLCYQFLYPQAGQVVDISQYVQKAILDEDMQTLTNVIRSSYESPHPIPRGRDVQLYLSHVYTTLEQLHGPDVQVLTDPFAKNVNKNKVCNMTIAFFEEILRLPKEQSGATLRYIVNSNQSP